MSCLHLFPLLAFTANTVRNVTRPSCILLHFGIETLCLASSGSDNSSKTDQSFGWANSAVRSQKIWGSRRMARHRPPVGSKQGSIPPAIALWGTHQGVSVDAAGDDILGLNPFLGGRADSRGLSQMHISTLVHKRIPNTYRIFQAKGLSQSCLVGMFPQPLEKQQSAAR